MRLTALVLQMDEGFVVLAEALEARRMDDDDGDDDGQEGG